MRVVVVVHNKQEEKKRRKMMIRPFLLLATASAGIKDPDADRFRPLDPLLECQGIVIFVGEHSRMMMTTKMTIHGIAGLTTQCPQTHSDTCTIVPKKVLWPTTFLD